MDLSTASDASPWASDQKYHYTRRGSVATEAIPARVGPLEDCRHAGYVEGLLVDHSPSGVGCFHLLRG